MMPLHEAVCPACMEKVIDMADGKPSTVTGWCPHGATGRGYMLALRPDADPMLLQAKPMTEAEADAMCVRVTEALNKPRRPGTLSA